MGKLPTKRQNIQPLLSFCTKMTSKNLENNGIIKVSICTRDRKEIQA